MSVRILTDRPNTWVEDKKMTDITMNEKNEFVCNTKQAHMLFDWAESCREGDMNSDDSRAYRRHVKLVNWVNANVSEEIRGYIELHGFKPEFYVIESVTFNNEQDQEMACSYFKWEHSGEGAPTTRKMVEHFGLEFMNRLREVDENADEIVCHIVVHNTDSNTNSENKEQKMPRYTETVDEKTLAVMFKYLGMSHKQVEWLVNMANQELLLVHWNTNTRRLSLMFTNTWYNNNQASAVRVLKAIREGAKKSNAKQGMNKARGKVINWIEFPAKN